VAQVIWTEPALNDLHEIIRHVAQDSATYAERLGTHLVEAPRRLAAFPRSGRVVPEFHDQHIRELIYGAYRIIYLIKRQSCYITAVVHGSRDVLRHVKPGGWVVA